MPPPPDGSQWWMQGVRGPDAHFLKSELPQVSTLIKVAKKWVFEIQNLYPQNLYPSKF